MSEPIVTALRCAKIHLGDGRVDDAMKALDWLLKQKKRAGVRMQAVKLILEHERDLAKHEDGQKLTIKNLDPITEFTVKIVNPPPETPPQENG